MLAIDHGRILLVPKGDFIAWEANHLQKSFPSGLVEDPSSGDVAAKAIIFLGNTPPFEVDTYVCHAAYPHAHERLLKEIARKLG